MKIETIDRDACKIIRQVLEHAIDVQEEEWEGLGLSATVGGASFTGSSVVFKVEVAVVSKDGAVLNREAQDFKRFAPLFGLAPGDLGRTFKLGGRTYTVSGCKSRGYKNPIIADRDDGKRFKFPSETVRALLSTQPAPSSPESKDPERPFSSDLDLGDGESDESRSPSIKRDKE